MNKSILIILTCIIVIPLLCIKPPYEVMDYVEEGRFEEAIKLIEKYLDENPTRPTFQSQLIQAYIGLQDWESAKKSYQRFNKLRLPFSKPMLYFYYVEIRYELDEIGLSKAIKKLEAFNNTSSSYVSKAATSNFFIRHNILKSVPEIIESELKEDENDVLFRLILSHYYLKQGELKLFYDNLQNVNSSVNDGEKKYSKFEYKRTINYIEKELHNKQNNEFLTAILSYLTGDSSRAINVLQQGMKKRSINSRKELIEFVDNSELGFLKNCILSILDLSNNK